MDCFSLEEHGQHGIKTWRSVIWMRFCPVTDWPCKGFDSFWYRSCLCWGMQSRITLSPSKPSLPFSPALNPDAIFIREAWYLQNVHQGCLIVPWRNRYVRIRHSRFTQVLSQALWVLYSEDSDLIKEGRQAKIAGYEPENSTKELNRQERFEICRGNPDPEHQLEQCRKGSCQPRPVRYSWSRCPCRHGTGVNRSPYHVQWLLQPEGKKNLKPLPNSFKAILPGLGSRF